MNTLKNLIKDIAAEKKLILLDTCHSGGICRRDGSDITPAMKEEVFQSFSSEDFVIITSCLENELSHEFSELEHGVFSYYLLSGLTGAVEVKDSFIDLYTLFIYVNRSVIDYVKEYKKRNQTPKFFGNLKGPFYLPKLSATAQPILDENISQFAKKPLDNESVKISFETINCIGIDESGKGDYFGPLVVAGVYVNTENKMEELRSIGIKDSKQLSDGRIIALARRIRKMCDNEVIAISPRRYNELYQDMANLNEILAWAHAQSMEQLLIRNSECDIAISDQFAWKDILINKLKQRGKNIHVIQRPKAEENVAVAAASILARAKFLDSLESLGKTNQASFSKGVADKVIEEAVFHLKRGGSLRDVAKMHFKTTSKVLKKYNK